MKKVILAMAVAIALAGGVRAGDDHDDKDRDDHHHSESFEFQPGTLVLTRSVYTGTAATVTPSQILPPGCLAGSVAVPLLAGGTVSIKVACGTATADGTYPTVFNNDSSDGNFSVTSPIFLDDITSDGWLLGTLAIPSDQIVTSFSSKSELAVNRSTDGKSVTFMGYRGGPGFMTGPNLLDASNSNTPGVIDPTNPDVSQYYRAVAEVDADGHLRVTETNAYSGDNSRAAIKANWLYYMAGNDNNGGLKTAQLTTTQAGVNLVNSTGAELLVPGQAPPVPPNITMIGRLEFGTDKPGKDTNFRGLTIFNNTLYVTKGSGSNGVNTVYQVGTAGTLPTGTAADLATVPITILPGFPNTAASTTTVFPFGIWFANANTLYVADEGDGCSSNGSAPCTDILAAGTPDAIAASVYAHAQNQKSAGLQKWVFDPVMSQWNLAYTIQTGLNLGVPRTISGYPTGNNAATGLPWAPVNDGLRNITGRVNRDGTVTIWAVTSTVSGSGDQGADPNQVVRVTDRLKDTSLSTGDGDHDRDDSFDQFVAIRSAKSGEVFRGVALAPVDHDSDDDRDHDHDERHDARR